jgi:inner membrane protein
VDVLAYLWGPGADLAFRRGWTHGVLALAVGPFVLAGAMLLLGRATRRLRRQPSPAALRPGQLLLLASISILSHPTLDTLNTYGVRWLMPFSGRWFYGDTLFIADPWMWLTLGLGVVVSIRAPSSRPARAGLWVAFGYAVAMGVSAVAARRIASDELAVISGSPVNRLLLSPVPVTPFTRRMVAEQAEAYLIAEFRWLSSPHLDPASVRVYPKGPRQNPAVRRAAGTTLGRRFLVWARFPAFRVEKQGAEVTVHVLDLRYAEQPGVGFGAVSIPVGRPPYSEVRE